MAKKKKPGCSVDPSEFIHPCCQLRKEEAFTFLDSTDILNRLGNYTIPFVFNGKVSVRQYKITIERVDEPEEVIVERLRKLKRESKNIHVSEAIAKFCKENSIKL